MENFDLNRLFLTVEWRIRSADGELSRGSSTILASRKLPHRTILFYYIIRFYLLSSVFCDQICELVHLHLKIGQSSAADSVDCTPIAKETYR